MRRLDSSPYKENEAKRVDYTRRLMLEFQKLQSNDAKSKQGNRKNTWPQRQKKGMWGN